jgi:helicase
MSNSVTISRKEFENFLGVFIVVEDPTSKEIIYEVKTEKPKINIRIYSSIEYSGVTRSIGEDAIRCVLIDLISQKPIDKAKRTHRMSNWKERLKEKIDELKKEAQKVQLCKTCGSSMVLREGPKGQFYGCLSYPKCKSSMDLFGNFFAKNESTQVITEIVKCPECDAPMTKRNGRRGEFYGCTNFFKTSCKGVRSVEEVEIYGKGIEEDESIEKKFSGVEIKENEEMMIPVLLSKQTTKQTSKQEQEQFKKQVDIIPASKFPHLKFKFENFNPVQSEVFEYYDKDVNCVVAAATSAGKTTVAEMFMSYSIAQEKKAIFLSPLKAVSQEKYDDWTNPEHDWSKLNVSIVTGDYALTDKRVEELNNANIIIMTTEMLDSRTRRITIEKNNWLLEAGTIVQDESHLLCVKGRGDKAESAIMRFTKQNPTCRVIFLSATMSNVDELAKWLSSLNNKKSELINSDYRPCQLDVHYEPYDDYGKYQTVEANKIQRAIEITQQYKNDKFIVFVHAKQTGKNIHNALLNISEKTELHNSELTLKDRVRITNEFKQKDGLRIIVATSTLAWGVNLPCRRAIVVGIHRGLQEVEPLDIKQMVGRSGRVGLDPKGDAHVLLPQSKFTRYKSWCQNIPPVTSTMNDQEILAFHIISEISEGEVYDIPSLMEWYNRSLAAFQSDFLDRVDAQELLTKLEKIKVIEKQNDKYKVTKLGKVAAYLYFSPYSIAGWYFNFNKLFSENRLDDISVSWALSNISDNNNNFAGRDMQTTIRSFVTSCSNRGLSINESCASIGILFHGCLTFSEELMQQQKNRVKFDIERTCTALSMIDKMYAHWNKETFWDKLQIRITNEVTDEQAELCTLKGIGSVRVRELFSEGIRTIADFKRKPVIARSILGNFYDRVLLENKRILE